jgi:hypothetical protein
MRFVEFAQAGAFGGMAVTAAVRLDLQGMNTENLRFYAYDKTANKLILIENPRYSVNAQGYLFFTTPFGSTVIITDGPFVRK